LYHLPFLLPTCTVGPSLGHQLSYLHFVLLMLEPEMWWNVAALLPYLA